MYKYCTKYYFPESHFLWAYYYWPSENTYYIRITIFIYVFMYRENEYKKGIWFFCVFRSIVISSQFSVKHLLFS